MPTMMERPTEGLLVVQRYIFYFLFMMKFPFMSEKTPKPLVYLWECLSWISVFLPLHMTICITKTVYDRFLTDNLFVLTTIGVEGAWFFFSFLGMVHYKRREQDIIILMDQIDESFKWRSPHGKTYVHMERLYKIGKYISIFWQLAPTSMILYLLTFPLVSQRPLKLPAPSWYPINQDDPYQFAVGYFVQSWAKMVMVSSFASGSSLYISFSLMCCGQFNMIRCGLKNLIYTSGVYQRFPETLTNDNERAEHITEYAFAHEIEEPLGQAPKFIIRPSDLNHRDLSLEEVNSLRAALKTCVLHHLAIVKVCTMMEEFLNIFAFLRIAEMTLQICFLAFMYAKTSGINALVLIILTFFDLFLLTFPADYIQFQSSAVGSSLMLGPWYLLSKYFRNDFIIIMAFSKRPIVFTAGKILRLNTDRFRLVITTAFSYYTLLSSFDNK